MPIITGKTNINFDDQDDDEDVAAGSWVPWLSTLAQVAMLTNVSSYNDEFLPTWSYTV